MKVKGHLRKMKTSVHQSDVQYFMRLVDKDHNEIELIDFNKELGKKISLKSNGIYSCVHCKKETKKSYSQGYCFECFSTLAECDMCIVKPETCHYDQGTCRDPRWAERYCMRPHYVYLANSSGVKVGITRETQLPTRWIDQGAVQGLPLLLVDTRHLSGLMEVELAKTISDKTNWRKMLQGNDEEIDLKQKAKELLPSLSSLIEDYGAEILDAEIQHFHYPVLEYPEKINSLSFEKTPEISGKLLGIKGQYLILDQGVLNIRKYNALSVELSL